MLHIAVDGIDIDELTEALELTACSWELIETPEPSKLSADCDKLPSSGSQRQAVLLFVATQGNATRDEIKNALQLEASSADPRVLELIQGGWISETGDHRDTRHGRKSIVLAPTDKCRRELRLVVSKWFPGGIRRECAR